MMTFLKARRLAFAACLCLATAACAPRDTTPKSPDLRRENLMALVLPKWAPSGAAQIQSVDLPEDGHAKSPTRALVTPTHVVRLAEDRAVMLATLQLVDQNGELMGGHAQGAQLGAWWFARRGNAWVADGSEHGFASSGSFGQPGELGVVEIAPARYALSVVDSWTGQGYTVRVLNLFELGRDKVSSLTPGNVRLDANNSGACPVVADKKSGRLIPERDTGDDARCFDFESRWSVSRGTTGPGDLVLQIAGRIDGPERDGPFLARSETKDRLVYHFKDGKYAPEHENPVPEV